MTGNAALVRRFLTVTQPAKKKLKNVLSFLPRQLKLFCDEHGREAIFCFRAERQKQIPVSSRRPRWTGKAARGGAHKCQSSRPSRPRTCGRACEAWAFGHKDQTSPPLVSPAPIGAPRCSTWFSTTGFRLRPTPVLIFVSRDIVRLTFKRRDPSRLARASSLQPTRTSRRRKR